MRNSIFLIFILLIACNTFQNKKLITTVPLDPHSFSNPTITVVNHMSLDLQVDFDKKLINGEVSYVLQQDHGTEIILDNYGLIISSVQQKEGSEWNKTTFTIDSLDPIKGSALHILISKTATTIKINYQTGAEATALQWMSAEQTATKKYPFLFTQSQSIYARSWIPCPDGPGMRFTYDAKVSVPKGMMAVMSAENPQSLDTNGIYHFKMDIPIPAYLLALAVGDLEFRSIGPRTGVYTEKTMTDKVVYEFADLEKMVNAAEELYGKYPWGRYDVLVLPPSFPFGGMENPRLTFATPLVIVGDRSLTSLLAHELAHSWSGNLVTNETWNDFWLNEGFTTYFENRIMEKLYGKEYADMLSNLGYQDLQKTMLEYGDKNVLTKLKLDLANQDPELGLSDIAYEKGKLFLRFMEERIGRDNWDSFLKNYFADYKFQSMNSDKFEKYLIQIIAKDNRGLQDTIHQWINNPGLLSFKPDYNTSKFDAVENQLQEWLKDPQNNKINTKSWSTHEWLHFLRHLPMDTNKIIIDQLDKTFNLTAGKNTEINCVWYEYVIKNHQVSTNRLKFIEDYLIQVGRRKLLLPIYKAMVENGLNEEAIQIFEKAQSAYHPISKGSVENIVKIKN